MLDRLLSHDLPRSRWLAAALLLILLALALAPFLFPGAKALGVAAKMLVFVLLVASYDLLLGYTGIVSFAHTMFFGIGAYGVAIACTQWAGEGGPGGGTVLAGLGASLAVSLGLSLLIGLFSLRVKAIFYAMITLAVAAAFQTLASQLSEFTGGEDGLSFKPPAWLSPSFEPFEQPLFGLVIDGKVISYYLILMAVLALFLLLLRIVKDRKSTRLNSSHNSESRMPSSA
jgi:branched-chain amino acid transport system permease protein